MYQLKFTLKQHTPIIHFQHHQDGATLRATEVKPKLDRFIIEKLGFSDNSYHSDEGIDITYKRGKEIAKSNGWLINPEGGALNYKMKIVNNETITNYLAYPVKLNSTNYPNKEENLKKEILATLKKEYILLAPAPHFSNSDKIKFISRSNELKINECEFDKLVFGIFSQLGTSVNILSVQESLIKEIGVSLNEFFIKNNFGNRTSKGFGSFTIASKQIGDIVIDNSESIIKKLFIKKSKKSYQTQSLIFDFISLEYQLLKAGTNRPYKKSEMFNYFLKDKIRWEKRIVKQELVNNGVKLTQNNEPIDLEDASLRHYNNYVDRQTNDYQYIRALLGLTDKFEFATDNRDLLKVKVMHIPNPGNEKIDRFESPILFKVINGTVYISINNSYNKLYNEVFEFTDGSTSLCSLPVPNNFDLKKFINNHISNNWINI